MVKKIIPAPIHSAMKAYRVVVVKLHAFLIPALDGNEWLTSSSGRIYSKGRNILSYPWDLRLCVPKIRSGHDALGIRTPASHYTELPRL
jgi:hypothetical protein